MYAVRISTTDARCQVTRLYSSFTCVNKETTALKIVDNLSSANRPRLIIHLWSPD